MKKTKFNIVAAIIATLIYSLSLYSYILAIIATGFELTYLSILPILLLTVALWIGKRNWFTIVSALLMVANFAYVNLETLISLFNSSINVDTIITLCYLVVWFSIFVFSIVSACQKQRRPLRGIWWIAPLLTLAQPGYLAYQLVTTNDTSLIIAIASNLITALIVLFTSLWLAFPYKKEKKEVVAAPQEDQAVATQAPTEEANQSQSENLVTVVEPVEEAHQQLIEDIDTAEQDLASSPIDFSQADEAVANIVIRPEDIYPITNLDGTIAPRPVNTAQPVSVLDSKVEKLLLYKEYLYRGVITEKEYAALKKKLLEE
ncbi:MAG: hypothetical protein IJZ28_03095 [Clostridia bacterium]|nr:hypothetical protein [Clostridia bacterium]